MPCYALCIKRFQKMEHLTILPLISLYNIHSPLIFADISQKSRQQYDSSTTTKLDNLTEGDWSCSGPIWRGQRAIDHPPALNKEARFDNFSFRRGINMVQARCLWSHMGIHMEVMGYKRHVYTWWCRDYTRYLLTERQRQDILVSQESFNHFEKFATTKLGLRVIPSSSTCDFIKYCSTLTWVTVTFLFFLGGLQKKIALQLSLVTLWY